MQHKKCPCKKKAAPKRNKGNKGRVPPVKAPVSSKVHHSKSSSKVSDANMHRGRIMYKS